MNLKKRVSQILMGQSKPLQASGLLQAKIFKKHARAR